LNGTLFVAGILGSTPSVIVLTLPITASRPIALFPLSSVGGTTMDVTPTHIVVDVTEGVDVYDLDDASRSTIDMTSYEILDVVASDTEVFAAVTTSAADRIVAADFPPSTAFPLCESAGGIASSRLFGDLLLFTNALGLHSCSITDGTENVVVNIANAVDVTDVVGGGAFVLDKTGAIHCVDLDGGASMPIAQERNDAVAHRIIADGDDIYALYSKVAGGGFIRRLRPTH
jgi:hypothetical protein